MNPILWFEFPGCARGSAPAAGLTLAAAGPMKIVRDGENRARVFGSLGVDPGAVISAAQIHSRVVHAVESAASWSGHPEGDGVVTRNASLVPCVTVADCMPVYLYDPVSLCFGVLHSGWRGTGIIGTALDLACAEWGSRPEDFRVILGPHIRDCCYTVDSERAGYFAREFGPSCVSADPGRTAAGDHWPWRLSLAEANRQLCLSLGIPDAHILDTGLCTACNPEFGSNRRQGAASFTHMAAFLRAIH